MSIVAKYLSILYNDTYVCYVCLLVCIHRSTTNTVCIICMPYTVHTYYINYLGPKNIGSQPQMVPSSFSSSTCHIQCSFLLQQQHGIKSTISWGEDDDCRAFDKPFTSHHLPQSSNSREKRRFVSIAKLVEVRIPRSRWDNVIINNHEVTSLSSVHPRPSDSPCSQEEDGPTGCCSVGGQVAHRFALLSPKSHLGGSCRMYRVGWCQSSILLLPWRTTCSL